MLKLLTTEKEILSRIDKIQRYYAIAMSTNNVADCHTWRTKLKSLNRILSLMCHNRI